MVRERSKGKEEKRRERELWKSLERRYYENGWSVRDSQVHAIVYRRGRKKKEGGKRASAETARSICILSSGHSIKLAGVFGICISIWTYAKKEMFATLTGFGLFGNQSARRNGYEIKSILIANNRASTKFWLAVCQLFVYYSRANEVGNYY